MEAVPSTQIAKLPERKPEIRVVTDPIAVLDTARFEHMQRIAKVMAQSNLIPDSLCCIKDGKNLVELPEHRIHANCFMVVNQAVRWGMDPFAVSQCVSVVKGKLCYEGKLIAAVIEAKLGIRLDYEWSGPQGGDRKVVVKGKYPDEMKVRTVEGTVGDWKTVGDFSPWQPKQYDKMLAYRGTREWARLHAPGLMLGVYSDDELADLADNARANRARVVQAIEPPDPDAAGPTPAAESEKPQEQQAPAAKSEIPDIPDPDADDLDIRNQPFARANEARAEKQSLFDTLMAEIPKLEDMAACFTFAQNVAKAKRLEPLTKEQMADYYAAFSKRQADITRG